MKSILSGAKRLPAMLVPRLPRELRKASVDAACYAFEEATYLRLAERGFRPAAIIDVGAFQGEWTRQVRSIFNDVPVLMVEAQDSKKPYLDAVSADLPKVQHVSALLSGTAGEQVTFYEMGTGSSLLPERSNVSRVERTLVTRSLDEVVDEAVGAVGPLFLKVDVQGAELHVLAGGSETLKRTEVVQLEVALLQYNEGAPTILEVMTFMDERDFVPFDVAGFIRPNGRDLVQLDMLFARRDSALRPGYFTY